MARSLVGCLLVMAVALVLALGGPSLAAAPGCPDPHCPGHAEAGSPADQGAEHAAAAVVCALHLCHVLPAVVDAAEPEAPATPAWPRPAASRVAGAGPPPETPPPRGA